MCLEQDFFGGNLCGRCAGTLNMLFMKERKRMPNVETKKVLRDERFQELMDGLRYLAIGRKLVVQFHKMRMELNV